MPARPSQDQPPAATPRRRSRAASAAGPAGAEGDAAPATSKAISGQSQAGRPAGPDDQGEADIAAGLRFRDAQTALELSLAELQSPDLDVEDMAGLYRRASLYAARCEQLLQQVEQEVMQWDPGQPETPPQPYQA